MYCTWYIKHQRGALQVGGREGGHLCVYYVGMMNNRWHHSDHSTVNVQKVLSYMVFYKASLFWKHVSGQPSVVQQAPAQAPGASAWPRAQAALGLAPIFHGPEPPKAEPKPGRDITIYIIIIMKFSLMQRKRLKFSCFRLYSE
jgi:hypothetical protein